MKLSWLQMPEQLAHPPARAIIWMHMVANACRRASYLAAARGPCTAVLAILR